MCIFWYKLRGWEGRLRKVRRKEIAKDYEFFIASDSQGREIEKL